MSNSPSPAGGTVCLFGLDLGTTTTSAVVAEARIVRHCVTGRREFANPTVVFRAEPVFTPFVGDQLDEGRLRGCFDEWIERSGIAPAGFACGGALVTGLAARAPNAAAAAQLVRARFGEALVVTADDPGLESWLAYLGNCFELSQARPETTFLNLDIGGGTTNPAWGRAGYVHGVGCYFIGARHVRVAPGTRRITGLSQHAVTLFQHLRIDRRAGDVLAPPETEAILDFYVRALEAVVRGDRAFLAQRPVREYEQVPFVSPSCPPALGDCPEKGTGTGQWTGPAITFSGGVGELIYRCARGEALPGKTAFGDLGIDLARRVCRSPVLSKDLKRFVPAQLGRATVYGLTLHTAELSGATLFLPCPGMLPLPELPVVGRLDRTTDDDGLRRLLQWARQGGLGACVQVDAPLENWQTVKEWGQRLGRALQEAAWPAGRPLVLLVPQNVGKTLGQYATDWGRRPAPLIVVDEIPVRRARFVSLGRPTENLVPVSFYGL